MTRKEFVSFLNSEIQVGETIPDSLSKLREIYRANTQSSREAELQVGTRKSFYHNIGEQLAIYRIDYVGTPSQIYITELTHVVDISNTYFNPNSDHFLAWKELASRILRGNYMEDGDSTEPHIAPGRLELRRAVGRSSEGKYEPMDLADLRGILHMEDDGKIVFSDANLFHFLNIFDAKDFSVDEILKKLEINRSIDSRNISSLIPILSHTAESVLIHRPENFKYFINQIRIRLGEQGFDTTIAICDDLLELAPAVDTPDWTSRHSEELQLVRTDLETQKELYIRRRHQLQEFHDVLGGNFTDLKSFFQELFVRSGAQEEMLKLFGQESVREIVEIAQKERKEIAGTILIIADMMGYPQEKALKLAAVCQMTWGTIISFDNLLDKHKIRKGEKLETREDEVSEIWEQTLAAYTHAIYESLHIDQGVKLPGDLLQMLRTSFDGDRSSRKLNFDTSREEFTKCMKQMVGSFSWFAEFIGESTSKVSPGRELGQVLSITNTFGQLLNDLEDVSDKLEKHEEGNDIGRRVTLLLSTIVNLPSNQIPSETISFIRKNWSDPRAKKKLLKIGRKYRPSVVRELAGWVHQEYYQRALQKLSDAKQSLEKNEVNSRGINIIRRVIEGKWKTFCEFGGIVPNLPLDSPSH